MTPKEKKTEIKVRVYSKISFAHVAFFFFLKIEIVL